MVIRIFASLFVVMLGDFQKRHPTTIYSHIKTKPNKHSLAALNLIEMSSHMTNMFCYASTTWQFIRMNCHNKIGTEHHTFKWKWFSLSETSDMSDGELQEGNCLGSSVTCPLGVQKSSSKHIEFIQKKLVVEKPYYTKKNNLIRLSFFSNL